MHNALNEKLVRNREKEKVIVINIIPKIPYKNMFSIFNYKFQGEYVKDKNILRNTTKVSNRDKRKSHCHY